MLVKICGIQTTASAQVAIDAGADLIGFVFAPSKRQISPKLAAKVSTIMPDTVQTVGVFVNETVENMRTIAEEVNLDFIQLHGNEKPTVAKQLQADYHIIKASPINELTPTLMSDFPATYYLIDSPAGKHRGGSGVTFDWRLLERLNIDKNKIILAGGLHADNVRTAINTVYPLGVDVSSGVETHGKKDHQKMKQFIQLAKGR